MEGNTVAVDRGEDKDIQRSRFIAYVLRHSPLTLCIHMNEHGWVSVEELIKQFNNHSPYYLDKKVLDSIVESGNRFSYSDDGKFIRANHGHSISVDLELEEIEPPKILYHGSAKKYKESIDAEGLKPKQRLYVHLSDDVSKALEIGSRHTESDSDVVLYYIKSEEMYKDGYKFYLSKDNVWLTKEVPTKYFLMVHTGVENVPRFSGDNIIINGIKKPIDDIK